MHGNTKLKFNYFVFHSESALAYFQIFLGEGVKESEEQIVQVDVTSRFGKKSAALCNPKTRCP